MFLLSVRYPIKELLLGEDSRIQTGGFWLLWCCWSWNMQILSRSCPFLETLKINMVLFDLPADGITSLLQGCKSLKHLGLVVDRNSVGSLCANATRLAQLETLELTCHIGLTAENMSNLIKSRCLLKLTALKFHSKHTLVFNDTNISKFTEQGMPIEYLEINAETIGPAALCCLSRLAEKRKELVRKDSKNDHESPKSILTKPQPLQNILIHNSTVSDKSLESFSKNLQEAREITLSNTRVMSRTVKISSLVKLSCLKNLRKLELSSASAFSDADLSLIPEKCTNLQWVELCFSFSFPKTLKALVKCTQLLYLKLHRIPINEYAIEPYRASSHNSKALLYFAKHCAKTLRMLDLGGPIGVSDYILSKMASLLSVSNTSMHTLFLESAGEHVTSQGIVKFAETRWKWLKRVNIRSTPSCLFNCVSENYLTKALEVEVIVDGSRLGAAMNRIENIV